MNEPTCLHCGDTGSVRVHSHEDYGVSFESEHCERCDRQDEWRDDAESWIEGQGSQ